MKCYQTRNEVPGTAFSDHFHCIPLRHIMNQVGMFFCAGHNLHGCYHCSFLTQQSCILQEVPQVCSPLSKAAQQIGALGSCSPCSRDESLCAASLLSLSRDSLGMGTTYRPAQGRPQRSVFMHRLEKRSPPSVSGSEFAGLSALLCVYQLAELDMLLTNTCHFRVTVGVCFALLQDFPEH